jgi:hypothetical protein
MAGIGLDVGEIRVFPLNNKKITLNITVGLLLKFNNSLSQMFISRAIN